VLKHIAAWNPTRELWETQQADLFSERLEPFSATWPISGMTQGGRLFPLPASAHHIAGSESLLLPTPVAQQSGNPPEDHLRKKPGRKVVTDLAILVENGLIQTGGMLPTPRASDGTKGGPNQRGSSGDLMLPSAVMRMDE
jgi:hypothetical protein